MGPITHRGVQRRNVGVFFPAGIHRQDDAINICINTSPGKPVPQSCEDPFLIIHAGQIDEVVGAIIWQGGMGGGVSAEYDP
jgi:hypothetical protein